MDDKNNSSVPSDETRVIICPTCHQGQIEASKVAVTQPAEPAQGQSIDRQLTGAPHPVKQGVGLTDERAWEIAVHTLGTQVIGCDKKECVVLETMDDAGEFARAILVRHTAPNMAPLRRIHDALNLPEGAAVDVEQIITRIHELRTAPTVDSVPQADATFEAWAAKKYPMAVQQHQLGAYARQMKRSAKEAWEAALATASRAAVPDNLDPLPARGSLVPRPLLYSETVNGQQVCRDDLWIVTTKVVDRADAAPSPAPVAQEGKAVEGGKHQRSKLRASDACSGTRTARKTTSAA